ncbi:hypothetical protein [Aliikangiella sp. G2MR2-5]|uniref:hypothetical protein n=1 Tax=Aliikangiella sp. G2MR2-5 TaxID=2788943 RepID=UPI0018A9EC7C|nr:hypothetical protein [Aliikangiella sp. G2MR2-5]
MQVFEMVAIITVVAIVAGVIKEWLNRQKTPEVDFSGVESRLDKLEQLEERVKVLEAIVTDKGYDLKSKIDNL